MVVTFALTISLITGVLFSIGFATPAFADDANDMTANDLTTSDATAGDATGENSTSGQNYSGVEVTSGALPSTDELPSKKDDSNCNIILHEMPQINLVSEKLTIPIRAVNTCASEIQVYLSGASDDDSRLEVISSLDTTLKPNSENVLDLPVHAKSNGDSHLVVTLASADGKSSSIIIEVHSVRDIGKAMSILFYAGVSVLLVGGVWRTAKKRGAKKSPEEGEARNKAKKKKNCCAKGS
jgi:hypothetical protein